MKKQSNSLIMLAGDVGVEFDDASGKVASAGISFVVSNK
jgi:hypothetical protein